MVDDTGFPKRGRHSVEVARPYCGQLGKQENWGWVTLQDEAGADFITMLGFASPPTAFYRGTKPFFLLGLRWTAPTCPTRVAARMEAPRDAPSGIIAIPLHRCEYSSLADCLPGYPAALSAARFVYDTVILGG
jgi:hypothetical protein